jgi:hypothetical protein
MCVSIKNRNDTTFDCKSIGENLLCPVRQWSGDPKVMDNAGNLQIYDKSNAGRKIKNGSREYL